MFPTEKALLEATNEWLWNVENNFLNGLFLDLKKAFDTMDHAILMGKLKLYGEIWLNLLTGSGPIYLTESKKCSDGVHNLISVIYITCGIPKGSIWPSLIYY